jgi:hypothetical protein
MTACRRWVMSAPTVDSALLVKNGVRREAL